MADYLSDDGSPTKMGKADMSVFRNAVKDCLDYEPEANKKSTKLNKRVTANDAEVERFSGLRIRFVCDLMLIFIIHRT